MPQLFRFKFTNCMLGFSHYLYFSFRFLHVQLWWLKLFAIVIVIMHCLPYLLLYIVLDYLAANYAFSIFQVVKLIHQVCIESIRHEINVQVSQRWYWLIRNLWKMLLKSYLSVQQWKRADYTTDDASATYNLTFIISLCTTQNPASFHLPFILTCGSGLFIWLWLLIIFLPHFICLYLIQHAL